jgi:hypothetical protein
LSANAASSEDHHVAVFQVLERKKVLEAPRVLRLTVEAGFPFGGVVIVKLFAFRWHPFLGSLAVPPFDDFFIDELDPAICQLVCVNDILRAKWHLVVANFVLTLDEFQQFLVAFRCREKSISFLFVVGGKVLGFSVRSFVISVSMFSSRNCDGILPLSRKLQNSIELGAERAARAAVGITAECAADHFRVGTMLNRDAERDRGVPGVSVGGGIALMI